MAGPARLSVVPEVRSFGEAERFGTFVVRIDPPGLPPTRPPARVVLALDTSGSMAYGRLVRALDCARCIVQALGTVDTFACVSFDSNARVLVPPTAMTPAGQAAALHGLRSAYADGNTHLAAGLSRALEIAATLPPGTRVLLLTDGCPTDGETAPPALIEIAQSCPRATVSTFGFGRAVDPSLLLKLAEAGRGHYTFIDGTENPTAAVGAELGGILRTTAIAVTLTIASLEGARIRRVDSAGRCWIDPREDRVRIDLNPLVADEPMYVAVEFGWEATPKGPIAMVALDARTPDGDEIIACASEVVAPMARVRGGADPDASKQVLLARVGAALRAASILKSRCVAELAIEVDAQRRALQAGLEALGLGADPQSLAALRMLESTRNGLLEASQRAAEAAKQDLVSVALAFAHRRSSMFLPGCGHNAFVTPSQAWGRRLLDEMWSRIRRN